MEIIKNNKGGMKLCVQGHMYTRKSESGQKLRWECSQRRAFSCHGSVSTDKNMTHFSVLKDHCHDSSPAIIAAAKLRCELKTRALSGTEKPGSILTSVVNNEEEEVRAAVGKKESTKRHLRRLCSGALTKDQPSLRELHVSGEWTTTGAPDDCQFLIYDNDVGAANRMLVFATQQALQHLCGSKTWYMDGTFSVSKRMFQQMYVIRAPLGTSAVTCIYALLSSKSQTTYEEFLQAVCETCHSHGYNPNPEAVLIDFEQAMINAVHNILGSHINIRCSFYHLSQNVWRKIQSLRLCSTYKDNKEFRHFCCMIVGLAFLPIEDIPDGLSYLEENVPDFPNARELLHYFKCTYVQGTYSSFRTKKDKSIKLRKVPAVYPPDLWNVHEAIVNNMCESWDSAFDKSVGSRHPTIWRFIDAIRQDQRKVQDDLLNDFRVELPTTRARLDTVEHQRRLRILCTNYTEKKLSLGEFLIAIGSCREDGWSSSVENLTVHMKVPDSKLG